MYMRNAAKFVCHWICISNSKYIRQFLITKYIGNIQIFRFLEGRKINNFSHIGSIFHKVSYSLYVSINRCLWNTYIIKPLIYYCLWYNFIIIRYFCKISVKRRQAIIIQTIGIPCESRNTILHE